MNRKPNDGKDFGVMPRSLPGLPTGDRLGNHLFFTLRSRAGSLNTSPEPATSVPRSRASPWAGSGDRSPITPIQATSARCLPMPKQHPRRERLRYGTAVPTSTGGLSGPLEIQVVARAGTTAALRDVLQAFPAAPNW